MRRFVLSKSIFNSCRFLIIVIFATLSLQSRGITCRELLTITLGAATPETIDFKTYSREALVVADRYWRERSPLYSESALSESYRGMLAQAKANVASEPWRPPGVNGTWALPTLKKNQRGLLLTGGPNVGKSSALAALTLASQKPENTKKIFIFVPEIATGFLSSGFLPPLNAKTNPWDLVLFQTALYILHIRIEAEVIEKSADDALLVFDRSMSDIDAYLSGTPDKNLPRRASEIFGINYNEIISRFDRIFVFQTPKQAQTNASVTDNNPHRFHDLEFAIALERRIIQQIDGAGYPQAKVITVPYFNNLHQKTEFLIPNLLK
jgi:hypothetical protein